MRPVCVCVCVCVCVKGEQQCVITSYLHTRGQAKAMWSITIRRCTYKTGKAKPSRQSIVLTTTIPSGSFTSNTLEKANRWITISGCSFVDLIKFDIIDTDDSLAQTQESQFIDISAGHRTYCLPDVSFICRTYSPQRLDIRLTPDRDECDYYNPCLNGGTCIDGCGTYACSCSSSFTGSLCQYENRVDKKGQLSLHTS